MRESHLALGVNTPVDGAVTALPGLFMTPTACGDIGPPAPTSTSSPDPTKDSVNRLREVLERSCSRERNCHSGALTLQRCAKEERWCNRDSERGCKTARLFDSSSSESLRAVLESSDVEARILGVLGEIVGSQSRRIEKQPVVKRLERPLRRSTLRDNRRRFGSEVTLEREV